MTKWFEQYKNPVLIATLAFFLLLLVFYVFFIRPLAAEEQSQMEQLDRIKEDVLFYEQELNKFEPQRFTEEEKLLLEGSVPAKANVEEIIKELEKAELENDVVIESIGAGIHPNELIVGGDDQSESDGETDGDQSGETMDQGTAQPGEFIEWEHILPSDTLEHVKDKLASIKSLTISYVELVVDVNGEPANVNEFVRQLEEIKRLLHVQGYDYIINEDKDNRLEGIVTVRSFYSEDFAPFIEEETEFALDYDFDPDKLNRYIGPELEAASLPGAEIIELPPSGTASVVESGNAEKRAADLPLTPDSPLLRYKAPAREANQNVPMFYVIQTGTYLSSSYLGYEVNKLLASGLSPRIIEDELHYVYTAAGTSKESLQNQVQVLEKKGFSPYVKTLPYRLTEKEAKLLLPEAMDMLNALAALNISEAEDKARVPEEQKKTAMQKITSLKSKIQLVSEESGSETRQRELQLTMDRLGEIESLLSGRDEGRNDSYPGFDGLLLDFMMSLNGYVPIDN